MTKTVFQDVRDDVEKEMPVVREGVRISRERKVATMPDHFNKLSPAQAERLAMLAEEAGEIVQIVGKILRHGLDNYHPDDWWKTPNRDLLSREIADFQAVLLMMVGAEDIQAVDADVISRAQAKKYRFTHHQQS